ncbi:hypothetical protein PSM7751_02375 [Pseudooceanicola marinus]|uniref:Uncharacterized protein n=2 Tax=Pseudooceanicola marinus TaxID=396013 RepID=A0A1X6ZEV0_9RHOB|nr:DUF5337 domain-containing protein [Pseudooceanicola marinus]MBY5972226.1 DUF5337 domain-containing protein [Ferrimonas balearica]MCA1335330.1 DUF5337 domain-containing protein [Pseudooceanicola marinus]SLN49223.1 hypothetical protein PSM7751_02375 [Pseudooceanicola marinus]
MTEDRAKDLELARKGRLVGIVIAVTMVLWMALQVVGGQLGLPERFVFLFDFAAIAAFVWALVVVAQIWRARRDDKG